MRIARRRIALVLLALVLATLFLRLGFWQLERMGQRLALNELRQTRLASPALALPSSLPELAVAVFPQPGAGPTDPATADSLLWRRIVADGVYDFSNEMVLRGRSFGGVPGVDVLTPLVFAKDGPGGEPVAILVKRGWLPAVDALRPDLEAGRPPETAGDGSARVKGVALPGTPATGSVPAAVSIQIGGIQRLALRSIDLEAVAGRLPYRLLPFYLLGTEPGVTGAELRPPEMPELQPGPHLSYAIQWFSFAAISILGTGLFLRRSGRDGPAAT
jgi:surfeit locus 1 family protein